WNDRVFLARPVVRVVVYIPCAHCAWPTRSYQGRLKTVRRDTARVAPDQITARRGIDTGTKEFGTGEESTPHDEQNPDMGSQVQHGKEANVIAAPTYAATSLKDLRSLLTGQVLLPEDAAYDQARQLWNGEIDKHPAAIVRCADTQDVVRTVRWA